MSKALTREKKSSAPPKKAPNPNKNGDVLKRDPGTVRLVWIFEKHHDDKIHQCASPNPLGSKHPQSGVKKATTIPQERYCNRDEKLRR